MSDAEVEYELILNPKQLGAPPPMRTEIVVFNSWKTAQSQKPTALLVSEITSADYDAYIKSGWTFHPDGTRKHYTTEDADIRLAAWVVRDRSDNRVFKTVEEAKQYLRPLGRSNLDLLVMAANRVNSVKAEDAEGNSVGTPEGSSPTT